MVNAVKEVALVLAAKSGLSKKQRDYSLLEICIIKYATVATVFADNQNAFAGVEKGALIEVTIDSSNMMSPRVAYVGPLAGKLVLQK